MRPVNIHASAISYVHGEQRPIAELEPSPGELAALVTEVVHYRASDQQIWQLAAESAELTLQKTTATPDFLLYVSEDDPTPSASVARLLHRLRLRSVEFLTASGHDCGNFGPAMRLVSGLLSSGHASRVLLVLADRVHRQHRVMPNGLSIFSDGAASCILTRDGSHGGVSYRIDAIGTRSEIRPEAATGTHESIMALVQLANGSLDDLLNADRSDREAFHHLVFPNYRPTVQTFLTVAMGIPASKLLLGPVTRYGHCFSADVLVTLESLLAEGRVTPGQRLLGVSIGPHSWSTMAITCTGEIC